MVNIPSTPADGNVKVAWVPAISDITAPTVAEVTAVGALDVSCYLTSDGWVPGLDETTIDDERLCTQATFEQPGRYKRSLESKYIENPGDATYNKAYEKFIPYTSGFVVVRRGQPNDTAFDEDDVVQVWPIKVGQRSPVPPEGNSVLKVAQKMHVTGEAEMDAVIS